MHSFRANCRCLPRANLHDFMRVTDIPQGHAALLSSSDSTAEYSSFVDTALKVNSGILGLSGHLQAVSESLKTIRLAIDPFRQLKIFFGSLEFPRLSNLITLTLTLFPLGVIFCLMSLHCF